jgi:hypothetical protein
MSMAPPDSNEQKTEAAARPPRPRQMRLFQITNPITTRLGAEVFAGLPNAPGVYFFYDVTGKLLYIGQSLNLRARVSSYRHVCPERHPRRTLRLVHRIARIDWQICETAEAAIELERVLLLQHRPPFNRAGTWQPPPWCLRMTVAEGDLMLALARMEAPISEPASAEPRMRGPARSVHHPLPFPEDLPPATFTQSREHEHPPCESRGLSVPRAIHAALCRCLMRLHHPRLPLAEYPAGLLNFTAPLHLRLPFPGTAAEVAFLITEYLSGRPQELLDALTPLIREAPLLGTDDDGPAQQPGADPDGVSSYWSAQVEMLQQFAVKKLPGLLAAG